MNRGCITCKKFRKDKWCIECNYEARQTTAKKLSTADVVEVVRCKDCLHGSYCEDVLWCNITDEPMCEDDYCSKGDRL